MSMFKSKLESKVESLRGFLANYPFTFLIIFGIIISLSGIAIWKKWSFDYKITNIRFDTSAEQYKLIGSFISPGESSFVKVLGTTAYLTDISEGLLVVDVSNPKKPVLLDKIKIGDGGAYALAIESNGSFAIVGGYWNTKVALVDISNPRNLKTINEVDAKRPVQDITLNVLELNDLFLAIDGPEIEIMKIEGFPFSLKKVVSQGVLEIANGGHINTLADYFDSASNTPYLLIGQGEDGISVYSFSLMTLLSEKLVTHISNIGYVNIVAADKDYIYAGVGNAIKVIDIKTQKEITDIKVNDVWNFKVNNNMFYVASGENGVKVLDISDIKNPKQIAVIDTPGRARSIDVSINGKYIYVADDRDDLQIISAQ